MEVLQSRLESEVHSLRVHRCPELAYMLYDIPATAPCEC